MEFKIKPFKATIMAIIYVILLVIAPYYIFLAISNSVSVIPISSQFLNGILLTGIISSIAAFFKSIFQVGTRLHGVTNIIFAIWFTYNLYYVLGGGTTDGFGAINVTFGYYSISINLSVISYFIIGIGLITVFIHLYEVLA